MDVQQEQLDYDRARAGEYDQWWLRDVRETPNYFLFGSAAPRLMPRML